MHTKVKQSNNIELWQKLITQAENITQELQNFTPKTNTEVTTM